MARHLAYSAGSVSGDTQPITLTMGEAVKKNDLLVMNAFDRKCYRATAAYGRANLNRQNTVLTQYATVDQKLLSDGSAPYHQHAASNNYALQLPTGNCAVYGTSSNALIRLYTSAGKLVAQDTVQATPTERAFVRRVDANRFAVITYLSVNSCAIKIYNNDLTVSQASKTYALRVQTQHAAFTSDFLFTSDGYVISFSLRNDNGYVVAQSAPLSGNAFTGDTNGLQNQNGANLRMTEYGGLVVLTYQASTQFNMATWNYRAAGTTAATAILTNTIFSIGNSNGYNPCVINAAGNLCVAIALSSGTILVYVYDTSFTQIRTVSATLTYGGLSGCLVLLGPDGSLYVFMTTGSKDYYMVAKASPDTTSITVTNIFASGSATGTDWFNIRAAISAEKVQFFIDSYNGSGAGYQTCFIDFDIMTDTGAIGYNTVNVVYNGSNRLNTTFIAAAAAPAFNLLMGTFDSANSVFGLNFRSYFGRSQSVVGCAASDAAKDAAAVVNTKGQFTLPSDQDFGSGLSFDLRTPANQLIVTGVKGTLLARNAVLSGIAT